MNPVNATLLELIDVRSEIGSEGRLCTAIAERLLPVWGLDGVNRIGNSLVVGKRTGKPMLSLYGHIDTVPAQGQGDAYEAAGRIYGLGASDMKSGVAVMIHVLEDGGVRNGPYDVVGVFYDREEGPADENGLIEVLERAPWLADAEFAVVLEPTDCEIQVGCQGAMNATVSFVGKAAHSARPWLGENAVTKAGAWLDRFHAMRPIAVTVDGFEFREVFSVTTATGGIARNIIPARFDLNLNYRFPPSLTLAAAEERLREVAAGADEITVLDRAPAASVPVGNPHMDRLVEAAGANVTAKQAWTDVARLTEIGVPAVNYGPGETAEAHQADESVDANNPAIVLRSLRRFLTI